MNGTITIPGEYKPGEPAPLGYHDWHEWAAVQEAAGIEQSRCGRCCKFKFAHEHSGYFDITFANTRADGEGENVMTESPICLGCYGKPNAATV